MNQEESWLLKEKYHGVATADFRADCARLKAGEPLAYVIGSIPFLQTTITLTSRPLIPRPETEFWVAAFIATARTSPTTKILDLCAGSGCIGVAVGHAIPNAQIDFVEIEEAHAKTIEANWQGNGLATDRMHIYIGNLFAALPHGSRYDVILSNPPYIDASLGRVADSVVVHEPARALYGGTAGLELIATILREAPQYLTEHGELWLEHEPEQVTAIAQLGEQSGFRTHTHEDQYGVARFSQLVLQ